MKQPNENTRNLTMLTDFYELTMANGYFSAKQTQPQAVFDLFFRTIPDHAGFAVFAGLEQIIDYIKNLKFTDEDLAYLKSLHVFQDSFLKYLKNFSFSGDIWAVPEGTPIFPNEPVLTVKAPVIEAQFIETMLLNTINHQSLIATKANRIVRAAKDKAVIEFGARRAQGYDAAIYGARAAYIGGCTATSCLLAAEKFNLPISGTMAHSWVQSFSSEYEAFKHYAFIYPNDCVLLIDTYNVLKSGLPNAIRVFDEILKPKNIRPKGIRIDSGDIAYLSKKSRKKLDEAGYKDVPIIVSNALDEVIIRDLILQNAAVDIFAVGENLITSKTSPVFGGVYKMAAVENKHGVLTPCIKLSETTEKMTVPHFKKVYRLYQKETNRNIADYITLHNENLNHYVEHLTIFDPAQPWKKKDLDHILAKELLQPIFQNGKCVYQTPKLSEIRNYCLAQIELLWDEIKRFEYPHRYYVDLSESLWNLRESLLKQTIARL